MWLYPKEVLKSLFLAVLCNAVKDVDHKYFVHKYQARAWFMSDEELFTDEGASFVYICNYLEIKYQRVREKAQRREWREWLKSLKTIRVKDFG